VQLKQAPARPRVERSADAPGPSRPLVGRRRRRFDLLDRLRFLVSCDVVLEKAMAILPLA